jgi:hypothetical protein
LPVARKKTTKNISAVVPAGDTVVVDSIPLSTFCAAKYLICIGNKTEDVHKSFELFASKAKNNNVHDTIGSKITDSFKSTTQVNVVGSDVELLIGNLEAFDFDVAVSRTLILEN